MSARDDYPLLASLAAGVEELGAALDEIDALRNDRTRVRPSVGLPSLERLAYSPEDVGRALGVSRQHIHNLIARGELPSTKVGRSRRILASDLAAFLTTNPPDGKPQPGG